MDSIRRAGRRLAWLVRILLVAAPVVFAGLLVWKGPLALLQVPGQVAVDPAAATIPDNIALSLILALTPLVYWWCFILLHDLASQYANGRVFTVRAVQRLRQIGLLLLLTDFVYMLQTAVTGPVLSGLGLSENFVNVELRLGVSVIGLFVVLVSRIMGLAVELEEQQRLTV